MCELVQVSRASFYRGWEQKAPGEAATALRDAVQRIAVTHRDYGYRRIARLVKDAGFAVGEEKVRGIMRTDNLLAVRRRKFVVTTDGNHRFWVYPNLAESLALSGIDQLWVADITYIRLRGEFVFLAVVLDAYSRKVIGWELGRTLETRLPLVRCPTLVISPTADPHAHPVAGKVVAAIAGAILIEVEGAMVPFPDQMPEMFAATTVSFLDRVLRT